MAIEKTFDILRDNIIRIVATNTDDHKSVNGIIYSKQYIDDEDDLRNRYFFRTNTPERQNLNGQLYSLDDLVERINKLCEVIK